MPGDIPADSIEPFWRTKTDSGYTGPYTYEPCGDVGPMPDYEKVFAD